MSPRTILVLGAQGTLGRFTAQRLKDAGHRVLRGGRRPEHAPDFRLVDLDRIETFSAAMEGVDLVVSSIEDPHTRAEREILRRGGVLISQATIPAADQRRLRADSMHGTKGTVVLNSGLTGVTALVIKDLLATHPEADTIEIGFVSSILASIGSTGSKTAHAWITSAPRLSVVERLFTPPHGLWPCFDMNHFDFLWLSEAMIAKRQVRIYIGIAERAFGALLRFLDLLGLLRAVPQRMMTGLVGLRPTPTTLTEESVRIRAAIYSNGSLLAARGIDARGDYNSTTISTTVFAQALLDLTSHQSLRPGVCSIEDVLQSKDVTSELNRSRIHVHALTG